MLYLLFNEKLECDFLIAYYCTRLTLFSIHDVIINVTIYRNLLKHDLTYFKTINIIKIMQ